MNRSFLLCALLFAAASPAFAQDGSDCPNLPADAGLTWKQNNGPDFVVCRAMRGDVQVFGMYFGNNPSYRHPEKDKAETSVVAVMAASAGIGLTDLFDACLGRAIDRHLTSRSVS